MKLHTNGVGTIILPALQMRKWSTERLSNLPKGTQLVHVRVEFVPRWSNLASMVSGTAASREEREGGRQ